MKSFKKNIQKLSAILLFMLLSSCASLPFVGEKKVTIIINASETMNKNTQGVGSPVVVKLYQLKEKQKLSETSFLSFYQHEKVYLGSDLVMQKQIIITPGEKTKLQWPVMEDSNYLMIVPEFIKPNNNVWNLLVPIATNHKLSLYLTDNQIIQQ